MVVSYTFLLVFYAGVACCVIHVAVETLSMHECGEHGLKLHQQLRNGWLDSS